MGKSASLEEGLDRSASKKGFHGAERHRYIGGAIRNMEKRGEISVRPRAKRATAAHKPAHNHSPKPTQATPAPARKQHAPSVKRGTLPAPGKTAIPRKPGKTGFRGTPKPREHLELTVGVNKAASDKIPNHTYQLYSIYKGSGKNKTLYSNHLYRKQSAAKAEAKIEMDRHNHPRGVHARPAIGGLF